MNNRKSRSSLKKVNLEEVETVRPTKRRISFSGKKFIREFDTTEKARDYDNSYEISDHTNGDDSSGQSHVTAAASTTIAAHISGPDEMDKENTPLVSVRERISSEYDQPQRNEFTLQLQTSVNVTLMPHELVKNRRVLDVSVPLESMAFDSLSLSDAERDKLRENSMFKLPVNEKTMDLMPHKMVFSELNTYTPDKENVQKTILIPRDMSCVAPKDVKDKDIRQKTVLFENNDITCDFLDIAPPQVVVAAKTGQTTNESFSMEDTPSTNYLPDDSTSSPLIPLDVISENGIGRKLNFCQLNEALNSGRIQPFRNGPMTPSTDQNLKRRRFWHGLEQQAMETEVPLRESIKPRGTLNFNESMAMSPPTIEEHLDKPCNIVGRNNRFSQADELMLDNTNFLAHAKMGDETQSRNSSKSASRRETTYDNTAMELDDLEKQEAAVAAALEKATRRPEMQLMMAMDENDLLPITEINAPEKQRLSQTMQLNETMEVECIKETVEMRQKLPIPAMEQEYVIRRQTLHLADAIEEDVPSPGRDLHTNPLTKRRQTLHFAEDIDEELPTSQQDSHLTAKQQTNQRRQTLHLAESIEEEPQQEQAVLKEQTAIPEQTKSCRQTLHFAEEITEDGQSPAKILHSKLIALPEQETSHRRQTLHMSESIEEDFIEPQEEFKSETKQQQPCTHRRQTVHMTETIEEDIETATNDIKSKPTVVRRQTVHFSADIEEEILKGEPDLQLNPNENQSNRRRQTLHLAEPIQEELLGPREELNEQSRSCRQTVQLPESIEEDIIKPQAAAAAVEGSIDEYNMLSPQKNIHSKSSKLERRQTLHTAAPIEEDSFGQEEELKSQPITASEEQQWSRRRQTIQMAEPIEEDVYQTKPATTIIESPQCSTGVPPKQRRQTMHLAERIEEDSNELMSPATVAPLESRQQHQQTVDLSEEIDEEPVPKSQIEMESNSKPKENPVLKKIKESRQTIHLTEPINEDIYTINDDLSCIKLGSSPPATSKGRQTLIMSVDMDEDVPRATKSRMKFLEAFDTDSQSPNLDKNTENTSQESQSDSAKWLAQMNANLRKTLVNPIKADMSKSILNPAIANRSNFETPKSNRTQRGCFAFTPGRSIIEYENLEEMCNIESPMATPTSIQPVDKELDMDISSYGTPIATTLINSKRLPVHLTPNLPQPKKRNKQEDQEISLQDVEQTPTAKNRSRIPVPVPGKSHGANSPWQEAEQLDGTVQMVRAQMMRQTRSLFDTDAIYPMENNPQVEATAAAVYEDNPITISDVSSHFAAQKDLAKLAENPKNTSSNSRSSNENSNKSYVRAHKKFINLSGDTVIFDAAEIIDLASDDNEIDKTRLSLVETLLDEEEDSSDNKLEAVPAFETETDVCLEQLNPPAVAGAADACKKCKHCRRSIDRTRRSPSESFVLPDWSALEHGLERLKRLRQQPRLEEVHKYWELKKLARYSHASDNANETILDANDNEERLTLPEMLEMFNKKFEECKRRLPEPVAVKSYVERLTVKLCNQLPNWIFDYQLQCDRQYIISHKKITTFRIVINYEPMDVMETEIRVRNIKAMTATSISKANWSVYEHLMDFQVRLRLPLNLLNLLDGNGVDDIVKFLQHVDNICLETTKLCNDMHLALISKQARLLRQSNRTVVRKTVRQLIQMKDEAYMRVEKTNFLIEIGNLEDISFKDIVQPPLYQLDEKIQFLPKGIDFLNALLQNPQQYLKPTVVTNN